MRLSSCAAGVAFALVFFSNAARAQMSDEAKAGHEIAERFCARCHAIGLEGRSPHESAPPFRQIVAKGNVCSPATDLSRHPMPSFANRIAAVPDFLGAEQFANLTR